MKRLFRNARWGYDGSPINLLVENGLVDYRGADEPTADIVTDLAGAFILPGFVDCHCHILPSGLEFQRLNLREFSSREDVLNAVRRYAAELPNGRWLLAAQYDQTRFEDNRHLSSKEVDAVTGARPAILRHASGHACIANTEALRVADISSETPNPQGGGIERGPDGKPTGLLLENAVNLVFSRVPKLGRKEMVDAILSASRSMSAHGITCAADMMTGQHGLKDELWAYQEAAERGCPIRIRLYVLWAELFEKRKQADVSLPKSTMVKTAGIKLFADGAIGAATAAIYQEYSDGGCGTFIYEQKDLERRIGIADRAGYQIAIHSIGDRSTDLVLDALRVVSNPSRHRIEHAMLLSDDQIKRIRSLGVRVTMQPEFLSCFSHTYIKQLGPERTAELKRIRSLTKAGVPVGLSSDRPVVPGDPWDGIAAAAERSGPFNPGEAVSIRDAVRLYTQGAADSMDDGEAFGSLKPGQWADFQVYESDPMTGEAKPAAVYLGGELQNAQVPATG